VRTETLRLNSWQISTLLRGEPETINGWIEHWEARRVGFYFAVIFAGAGLFGFAMGWWRSPLQAAYTALKFPLIILLTTFGNALLNGMLAPLLGLNLNFRQSLLAILMSFTIAAAVLGGFSPLLFFLIWNTPPLSGAEQQDWMAYSFIRLALFSIIAFAGIAANVRLIQLLRRLSGTAHVARKILLAWLAGNLLLGSQLSWILRPFIGSPVLPVEFLRTTAFQGNLFETLVQSATALLK
jgi:hypothetical protein